MTTAGIVAGGAPVSEAVAVEAQRRVTERHAEGVSDIRKRKSSPPAVSKQAVGSWRDHFGFKPAG